MSSVASTRRIEYRRLLPALLTAEPYGDGDRLPRSTRDWIVDVIAFLVAVSGVLLTWLDQRNGRHPETGYLLVTELVVGFLAAGSIWLRRRWPIGLCLVVTR